MHPWRTYRNNERISLRILGCCPPSGIPSGRDRWEEGGYFTRTTKVTLKLVPVGMVPVVVHRTLVTQKSYPAGAAHPPETGVYAQVDPLLLE
jgi:hypothetical protein